MLRLVVYLVGIAVLATGLSWLADRPGLIVFNWEGYEGEISVFHAVVALTFLMGVAILLWSLGRAIWTSPATVGNYFYRRRQKRGLEALSSGIIAIGAGDGANAMRHAVQARKTLPNEPLTHLLRAQAAQLAGDKTTTRRIFEAMLSQPDTEQLGLRGLFLEAQREGELEAAKQFAERALKLNPKLGWSADALFDLQCKASDWPGALQTLALAKKHAHIDKSTADRRRAVLLTAQAQKAEDSEPDRGLALALEAHNLAPGLVPAAAIAGRLLASRGNTAKAAKVLQKTWLKSPHPDLAQAYSYARIGDSPKDRLDRVRQLAGMQQNSIESPIAVARVAIEAKAFDEARGALEPLLDDRLTQRVATLMARIEAEEKGDAGRVREWLARAVTAQRDPAWTADGVVAEQWAPVSPVTGQLDAFQWRVPVEALESVDSGLLADKLAELAALGAPLDAIEAKPLTVTTEKAEAKANAGGKDAAGGKVPSTAAATAATAIEIAAADAPATVPGPAPAAAPAASSAKAMSEPVSEPAAAAGPQVSGVAVATPAAVSPAPAASAPATAPTPVPAPVAAGSAAAGGKAPATTDSGAAAGKSSTAVTVVVPAERDRSEPSAKGVAVVSSKDETASPAGAAPGESKAKDASASQSGDEKGADAKIFISPRAPDDPGTEVEEAEAAPLMPRYGTSR